VARARVLVLEDVAFRVDGLRFREHVLGSYAEVIVDLSTCSLAQGMWALPAIEAIAAELPARRLGVHAGDDLAALVVAHLRALGREVDRRVAPEGARAGKAAVEERTSVMVVDLSPRLAMRPHVTRERDGSRRLHVPARPFPKRAQHAWGHWVDGVRACGFDARAMRPRLCLRDEGAARAARRWLRERFGRRGRTLVALLPSAREASWGVERFAEVGRELEKRLGAALLCHARHAAHVPGAVSFDGLDIVTAAHVLGLVAVAIGDADGGLVHVAAAAGAGALSLHGASSPEESGAASDLGAAIAAERCRCPEQRTGCLACIGTATVVDVAEGLAGRRWPWDRLAQVGLLRPELRVRWFV
jgi:hypothetical protein